MAVDDMLLGDDEPAAPPNYWVLVALVFACSFTAGLVTLYLLERFTCA